MDTQAKVLRTPFVMSVPLEKVALILDEAARRFEDGAPWGQTMFRQAPCARDMIRTVSVEYGYGGMVNQCDLDHLTNSLTRGYSLPIFNDAFRRTKEEVIEHLRYMAQAVRDAQR
jgi:hypothetical protein